MQLSIFAESPAQEVVARYAEAERLLLERIAKALAKGLDAPGWAEQKLAQIRAHRAYTERLIEGLEREVTEGASDALVEAYRRGGLVAMEEIARAGASPGVTPEPLGGLRALEDMTSELLGNLKSTHQRILRSSMDIYRSVIAETASQVLLGTQTRREACQTALDRFAQKGITGFIDARGRGWDLSGYTEMAMRAGTMNAAVQGQIGRIQEYGLDLVIVSDAPGECPVCRVWEGRVLSSSGRDPDHPSLAQARAQGLFHPGCRHSVSLYQEGITQPPKGPTADPKGDRARQRQRYLERQVRESKRMQAMALDDKARAKATARVKAYQAKLRKQVEATGGKRLSYREQVSGVRDVLPIHGRVIDTGQEATNWSRQAFKEWQAKLTPRQRESFAFYSGSGYGDINEALRYGYELPPVLRGYVRSMDTAIRRGATRERLTLYRGVGAYTYELENIEELVGLELPDLGYESTSFLRRVAEGFADEAAEEGLVLRIDVPKDSHVGYLERLEAAKPTGANLLEQWEYEILLPRGSRFRVRAVTEEGGRKIVDLELMP